MRNNEEEKLPFDEEMNLNRLRLDILNSFATHTDNPSPTPLDEKDHDYEEKLNPLIPLPLTRTASDESVRSDEEQKSPTPAILNPQIFWQPASNTRQVENLRIPPELAIPPLVRSSSGSGPA